MMLRKALSAWYASLSHNVVSVIYNSQHSFNVLDEQVVKGRERLTFFLLNSVKKGTGKSQRITMRTYSTLSSAGISLNFMMMSNDSCQVHQSVSR